MNLNERPGIRSMRMSKKSYEVLEREGTVENGVNVWQRQRFLNLEDGRKIYIVTSTNFAGRSIGMYIETAPQSNEFADWSDVYLQMIDEAKESGFSELERPSEELGNHGWRPFNK